MRPAFVLRSHLIRGICILLYMMKAEAQRVLKSSIPNDALKKTIRNFYLLTVAASIYVAQYQPQNISKPFLQSCFEPQLSSEIVEKKMQPTNKELCHMYTYASIDYFRKNKTQAELEQVLKFYFNQILYKIITIHQLSRVILK